MSSFRKILTRTLSRGSCKHHDHKLAKSDLQVQSRASKGHKLPKTVNLNRQVTSSSLPHRTCKALVRLARLASLQQPISRNHLMLLNKAQESEPRELRKKASTLSRTPKTRIISKLSFNNNKKCQCLTKNS